MRKSMSLESLDESLGSIHVPNEWKELDDMVLQSYI
jgi:hypothetical protein